MLKKLKNLGGGLYRWKLELRIGDERVHNHIELTERAAHQMHAELLERRERLKLGLPAAVQGRTRPIGRMAAEYEQHLYTLKRSDNHVSQVVRTLAALRKQLSDDAAVESITRDDLIYWQNMRAKSGVAARTLNKERSHLSAFFEFCGVAVQLVPRVQEVSKPISAPTWKRFCEFADAMWEYRPALALVAEVKADSGARISEVLAAKSVDVDRGMWRKRVKGNKVVLVPASPWVLHAASHGHEYLCPREDGKPFKYHVVKRAFDKFNIRPHELRHGRATWDVEQGLSARQIQEKLAHSTIKVTEEYFKHAKAMTPQKFHLRLQERLCRICDKRHGNKLRMTKKSKAQQRRKDAATPVSKKPYNVNRYVPQT